MAAPNFAIAPPERDVPEVKITTDVPEMVNQSIAALARDAGVFQRSGQGLVRVVRALEPPSREKSEARKRGEIRRPMGAPMIEGIPLPHLYERIAGAARWLKYDGRRKTDPWVKSLPPEKVASWVVGRGEWGGVPALLGAVTAPTFRLDGTILQGSGGYDAESQLLYWPNAVYPEVHDPYVHDAKDVAIRARDALLEVVGGENYLERGFPFAKPFHRSAWLASLLTLIARPAIDGPTPLFAVDATTGGTGKTMLIDTTMRLALGRQAAAGGIGSDEAEWEKMLVGVCLSADPAFLIDNVPTGSLLKSAVLERWLAGTLFRGRLLGGHSMPELMQRTVCFLTANNITYGGELGRRTMQIRLSTLDDRPYERTGFLHGTGAQFFAWLAGERPRLIAAALTLLRAYIVAGAPQVARSESSSFSEWAKLIANAVAWVDMPDPLDAQLSTDKANDPDALLVVAFTKGIPRISADPAGITGSFLVRALYMHSKEREGGGPPEEPAVVNLREQIEVAANVPNGKQATVRDVGYLLRKIKDRPANGLRVVRGDDTDVGAKWRVEKI